MSGINCLFCEYIGDLIGLRAHSATCPNHPLRAKLQTAEERAEKAEKLLEVSEDYRRAYQDGKYKLYAHENEAVREAAAQHLPCGEGPLERAVDAVAGAAQLKRMYCNMKDALDISSARNAALAAHCERLRTAGFDVIDAARRSVGAAFWTCVGRFEAALAATPEMSLEVHDRAVKVAALRAWINDDVWCETGGTRAEVAYLRRKLAELAAEIEAERETTDATPET